MSPSAKASIRRDVVHFLTTGQEVTLLGSAGSGLRVAEFYPSVDAAFVDIVASVVDLHFQHLSDVVGRRRRSTHHALAADLLAFWDVVHLRVDDHLALQVLRLREPSLLVAGPDTDVAISALPTIWAQRWLHDVATVQGLAWLRPETQLAQLVVATLDGVFIDYLHERDIVAARQTLELFAYHLSQHGSKTRRNFTSQPG